MERLKQGLDGSTLKLTALITMLVDHAAYVLVDYSRYPAVYVVMREIIGRISFPLFCFLLTEGFIHTHNAIKYASRLALFAILSELPFDLTFYHRLWQPAHQNVFFTLLFGFLILCSLQKIQQVSFRPASLSVGIRILLSAGTIFLFCALADGLHTDYGSSGVLLITAFYLFKGQQSAVFLSNALFNVWKNQPFGILSAPLIALYNGRRGRSLKYFFYLFYPLHLFLLYLITS